MTGAVQAGLRVTPCGAAGEVTGSGYLVESAAARVLVDFGLFQGAAAGGDRNAALGPVDPGRLDAVVLTHAHLDHSGRLPLLVRHGYRRRVFATPATADLVRVLLADAARLDAADRLAENRRRRRAGEPEVTPLYGLDDVRRLGRRLTPLAYGLPRRVAPGVTARLFDAGHILGAASVELEVDVAGGPVRLVFSGDIGAPGQPLVRDPVPPRRADAVVMESTYGDRDHPPHADTVREFVEIVRAALVRGHRVLIPAFAVGRTQTVLVHLDEARRAGRLPPVPVFLDSPLARRATAIYARHQALYAGGTGAAARRGRPLPAPGAVQIIQSVRESRALNAGGDPCVVIAGSGMCDGGRIVHHLRHHLWREGVVVLLLGYLAPGTLGRDLADGARRVEIFSQPVAVRATVRVLPGFSAHAGQRDLVAWLAGVAAADPLVALTHGEDGPRQALRERLRAVFGLTAVRCPGPGETIDVARGGRTGAGSVR